MSAIIYYRQQNYGKCPFTMTFFLSKFQNICQAWTLLFHISDVVVY